MSGWLNKLILSKLKSKIKKTLRVANELAHEKLLKDVDLHCAFPECVGAIILIVVDAALRGLQGERLIAWVVAERIVADSFDANHQGLAFKVNAYPSRIVFPCQLSECSFQSAQCFINLSLVHFCIHQILSTIAFGQSSLFLSFLLFGWCHLLVAIVYVWLWLVVLPTSEVKSCHWRYDSCWLRLLCYSQAIVEWNWPHSLLRV